MHPRRPKSSALLAAGIVLAGFSARLAVASVPPLLPELERSLSMSATAAGLLTSVPFACFGLLAPIAALCARRLSAEAALALVLATMAAGTLVRAAGSATALFAGTAVAAAGIAAGNVAVPTVVKERFPTRVGALMALYTAALSTGAALAGGLAVPVSHALGWQAALAVWSAPVAVALVPVLAASPGARRRPVAGVTGGVRALLGEPLAWQVTLFFGLQAAIVFGALSWLPSILAADGYAPGAAGALVSVFAIGAVPTSLAVPPLAARLPDQRMLVVGAAAVEMLAAAGLAAYPTVAPAWVVLFALGQGASFSLAMTLIVLRAPDPRAAADLSGMAQAIGYCIAAGGPFATGLAHTALGGWTAPLLLLTALGPPMTLAGICAGRARVLRRGRGACDTATAAAAR